MPFMYSAIAAKNGGPVKIPTFPNLLVSHIPDTVLYLSNLSLDKVFEWHSLPGSAVPLANLSNSQQWQTITGAVSLEAHITDIPGQVVVFFKSPF